MEVTFDSFVSESSVADEQPVVVEVIAATVEEMRRKDARERAEGERRAVAFVEATRVRTPSDRGEA